MGRRTKRVSVWCKGLEGISIETIRWLKTGWLMQPPKEWRPILQTFFDTWKEWVERDIGLTYQNPFFPSPCLSRKVKIWSNELSPLNKKVGLEPWFYKPSGLWVSFFNKTVPLFQTQDNVMFDSDSVPVRSEKCAHWVFRHPLQRHDCSSVALWPYEVELSTLLVIQTWGPPTDPSENSERLGYKGQLLFNSMFGS